MKYFKEFLKELKKKDKDEVKNKENLLKFLKVVKYIQENPSCIHHVRYKKFHLNNFIAFVRLQKEKLEFYFNNRRLTNRDDMVYAYFHEIMHAALNHLGITLGSGNLRNIIHDIEVNMYVDSLTDIAPQLHKILYMDSIERFYKYHGRSAAFLAYMISRNLIKKEYGSIENFVNAKLSFLSEKDKKHFIKIEKKMMDCKITFNDLINEVHYWDVEEKMEIPVYEKILRRIDSIGDTIGDEEGSEVENMKYMNFLSRLRYFIQHSYELNKANGKRRMETVLPLSMGRKEIALLSAGLKPVIYNLPRERYYYGYKKLNIYIDSSGSMDDYLPYILGLVNYLKDTAKEVYTFDVEVKKIKIDELGKKINRLGGTNIDSVLKHIKENNIINAVIFTDMIWGVYKKDVVKELEKKGVSLFIVAINDDEKRIKEGEKQLGKLVKASVVLEERRLKNARSV